MKKIIAIAMALLLVLALAVGCGKADEDGDGLEAVEIERASNSQEDSKGSAWPGSSLPDGFPEYPGGAIDTAEAEDDGFYIEISETDRASYDAYTEMLVSAGWVFQEYDFGMGADTAFKDGMRVILLMDKAETSVAISISLTGGKTYVDWPAEAFPEGFPVYPDGLFVRFEQDERSVRLYVERSAKDDFDSFVEALKAAGWDTHPHESVIPDEDDEDGGIFTYSASNSDDVNIVVVSWTKYGTGIYLAERDDSNSPWEHGNDWPADLSGSIREYPDGIISYTTYKGSDSYRITVLNTSVQSFNSYTEALIKDGFEAVPLDDTIVMVSMEAFIFLSMDDSSSVSITVDNVAVSPGGGYVDGWPKNLPVKLPAYPDGDIKHMERNNKDSMSIHVEYTSQASYDAYIDTLQADGWALSGARDATDNTLTKGSSKIRLSLKVHEGNTWINIDLTY